MHKRNIGILTERMPHKNSRCKEEAGAGEEGGAGEEAGAGEGAGAGDISKTNKAH